MTGSSETGPALPRLHLVMDDRVFTEPGFTAAATGIMEAGRSELAFHLRAPGATGRAIYEAGRTLADVAGSTGSLLLVNDRVDVAMAVGAGGVQLPARGLPPASARALMGSGPAIGASVHTVAEAEDAAGGADFLLVGTVFGSASHPDREGSGVSLIREIVPLGRPVIGIGGITPAHVPELLAAGAHGVAALGAVWHAADPQDAVRRFLETMKEMDR